MECKALSGKAGTVAIKIGIYPEWNVKTSSSYVLLSKLLIGIYPEWNVKYILHSFFILPICIGIYPEWNVKCSHH